MTPKLNYLARILGIAGNYIGMGTRGLKRLVGLFCCSLRLPPRWDHNIGNVL